MSQDTVPSLRPNRVRHRSGVRRVVGMEIVSGLGDGVFWVGLIAILLEQGVGARGFALAVLVRLGPRALLSAPAGVLADRVDRRRLLVGIDLFRAGTMAVMALTASADVAVGWILVPVLVSYTLAGPYRPAVTAAMPLVAGERGLSSANALVATVRQLMTFLGPLLGAAVLHWGSPTMAFWANAVSFLVAAALVATVTGFAGRPPGRIERSATHPGSRPRALTHSWGDVRATPGLLVITVVVFAMYAVRGAELVLYALIADEQLGLGPTGFGLLTGAIGLGALLVLPAISRLSDARRPDGVVLGSMLLTAVPLAALASTSSSWGAAALLLVIGAAAVAFEVVSVVMLQRMARLDVLGRVFGVLGTAGNLGKLIGAVAAPGLVLAFDLDGALLAMAASLVVVALACVVALRNLSVTARQRRAELEPIVVVLSDLGIFEGASRLALERVAASVDEERAASGDVVLRQGDPADDLFVVREGELEVTDHGRPINEMGPGAWFGEIGLLQRRARTATVTASTDVVLWRIPGSTFLSALENEASEPNALIDVMAERLARSGTA